MAVGDSQVTSANACVPVAVGISLRPAPVEEHGEVARHSDVFRDLREGKSIFHEILKFFII